MGSRELTSGLYKILALLFGNCLGGYHLGIPVGIILYCKILNPYRSQLVLDVCIDATKTSQTSHGIARNCMLMQTCKQRAGQPFYS